MSKRFFQDKGGPPHLHLVHSVAKPEVETAASAAPGIDAFQNALAGIDRVRQLLLLYAKGLENPPREVTQILTILGITIQGFEDGLRDSEKKRRDSFRPRKPRGGER